MNSVFRRFPRAENGRRKMMGLLDDLMGMAGMGNAGVQPQQHAGALSMLLEFINSPPGWWNRGPAADVPRKGPWRRGGVLDRHGTKLAGVGGPTTKRSALRRLAKHRCQNGNGSGPGHLCAFADAAQCCGQADACRTSP